MAGGRVRFGLLLLGADGSCASTTDKTSLVRRHVHKHIHENPTSMQISATGDTLQVLANVLATGAGDGGGELALHDNDNAVTNEFMRATSRRCKRWCTKTRNMCQWDGCRGCRPCKRAAAKAEAAKASFCKDFDHDVNACDLKGCGFSYIPQDDGCQPCETMNEAKCRKVTRGCIFTKSGCREKEHIDFGGDNHRNRFTYIRRPEQIHSTICHSGKCQGCTSRSVCWHGEGDSSLKLKVPPGTDSSHTMRSAQIWLRCGVNSGETFGVKAEFMANSHLDVFIDGKKQSTLQDGKFFALAIPVDGEDHVVSIEHTLLQKSQESEAQLRVDANVSPWADQCLSNKVCLAALGDGSDASFEIRNSNRLQYDCLDGFPAAKDKTNCDEWRRCQGTDAAKDPTKLLKAMLHAALGKTRSQLVQAESQVNKVIDDENCIDPYTADPEAWECECMDTLHETCGLQGDIEKCLNAVMCQTPKICCAWKQDNCQHVHCQGALMSQRAAKNDTMVADSLFDDTLSGKCSQ